MTFQWFSFFAGLTVAAVVAGFTMTVGGPDTAVAAVAIPLLAGIIGIVATAVAARRAPRDGAVGKEVGQ